VQNQATKLKRQTERKQKCFFGNKKCEMLKQQEMELELLFE
jgi:hypothetical protein